LVKWLLRICIAVWTSERISEDWKRWVMDKTPKKGDVAICANNLLSISAPWSCCALEMLLTNALERIKLGFERDAPAPISVLPYANL